MSTKLQMLPHCPARRASGVTSRPVSTRQKSVRFMSIKPIIDERPSVRDHLSRTSVVYAKKTWPRTGAKLGQRQVTQLRLKDWGRYNWTLPPVPACRRPWQSPVSDQPPRPARQVLALSRDSFLRESGDGAETTRSLPPLGRSALGQPMLRRPTTGLSDRNTAHALGDELMDMLGNYLDLKPIASHESQGDNTIVAAGSVNFYKQHFPLLLRKKEFSQTELQGDSKVVSQRQILGRQTSEQKRRADLSRRCRALDRALTSLERGADDMEEGDHLDDGVFVTELREDTFDPRSWPWNAERYQI